MADKTDPTDGMLTATASGGWDDGDTGGEFDDFESSSLYGVPSNYSLAPVPTKVREVQPWQLDPWEAGSGGTTPIRVVDETSTVAGMLQGFYGMDRDSLSDLQKALYAGGFYDDGYYTAKGKKPRYGDADDDSYAAFKRAVVRSSRAGKTIDEVLAEGIDATSRMGDSGPARAGRVFKEPIFQPTPDVEIESGLVAALQEQIGRAPAELVARLKGVFQQAEQKRYGEIRGYARREFDLENQAAESGQDMTLAAPTLTAAPTAENVAAAGIDPAQAEAFQAARFGLALYKMFGGAG